MVGSFGALGLGFRGLGFRVAINKLPHGFPILGFGIMFTHQGSPIFGNPHLESKRGVDGESSQGRNCRELRVMAPPLCL